MFSPCPPLLRAFGATAVVVAAAVGAVHLRAVARASVVAQEGRAPAPPRPLRCREVAAGEAIQRALDTLSPGESLCLAPGEHHGAVRLTRPVTLWGPRAAVLRSTGEGTTVRVEPGAAGARLLGFTVRGSGGRYDQEDAGVRVEANDVEVRGVRVERAVFGVLVYRARAVTVREVEVVGSGERALGLRGDGIRLWEAQDCLVEGNRVRASRDVVVWYSPRNRVVNNTVVGGRYGTHLMYANDCVVEGNRYRGDEVGVFVMYSHRVTLGRNVITEATGAAGVGVGLKDSGDVTMTRNDLAANTVGLYLDQSPGGGRETNRFHRNAFRGSRTAVVFHACERGNVFDGNAFVSNAAQVAVEGGAETSGARWEANVFDDYQGYDLDGDGRGDVPYTVRSLVSDLRDAHPDLGFFDGTPALALLDVASRVAPLYAPRTLVVDAHPRVGRTVTEVLHAN
jgi:nitrous oxidase accessory protein